MNTKPLVVIKKMPIEDIPITNPNFGYFYEENIKKKTLRHISTLKSIYDPGVFFKNGRNIRAIKAFIIKGKNKQEKISSFNKAVNENEFIIFPYLLYTFDFSVDKEEYHLKIMENNIIVYKKDFESNDLVETNTFYKEGSTIYFDYKNEKYYFSSFCVDGSDCWQIYLLQQDLFMIVFKMELEIDGFLLAENEFNLDQYKAEEIFFCNLKENHIVNKDSYIIYEIKSGKDFASLSKQIIKDFYFFNKYLDVYPKYDKNKLIIFGFLRTSKKIEDFSQSHKNDFENLSKIPVPVILFRYQNLLFGENIELGEIGELKVMVHNNSEKIEKLSRKMDDLKDDLKKILEKLDGNKSQSNENIRNQFGSAIQQIPIFPNNMDPNTPVFFMPVFPTSSFIANQSVNTSKDEELSKKS